MVASGGSTEANGFAIPGNPGPDPLHQTFTLTDPYSGASRGQYALQVFPPDQDDSRLAVRVTGKANSPAETARTVEAHLGRPSFSEYILLVDDNVYIGGPANRVWHGKTHSNTGIRIETENIIDTVTCANEEYEYGSGNWKDGVWSQDLPLNSPSRSYWHFPVPPIDFDVVTSDFNRLSSLALGQHNLPFVGTSTRNGWYIRILPNRQYQVAQVTDEYESRNYVNGNARGGYLTYGALSAARPYPNSGVIYANDDVWVEGTDLSGRLTIASSGQLNPPAQRVITHLNIVGDLTTTPRTAR
jgi:hypothetical protein